MLIAVLREALRQLPGHRSGTRPGRKILIRSDSAGAIHDLLDWITSQRLSDSVGFPLPDTIADELAKVPEREWQPAYDADREPRPGAWVLEVTGLLELSRWPKDMRVIVRRERPHPGAQLRLTDADGNRLTAFATNTPPGGPGRQLADLSLAGRLARPGRLTLLHLPRHAPWAALLAQAITTLRGPWQRPADPPRPPERHGRTVTLTAHNHAAKTARRRS